MSAACVALLRLDEWIVVLTRSVRQCCLSLWERSCVFAYVSVNAHTYVYVFVELAFGRWDPMCMCESVCVFAVINDKPRRPPWPGPTML